MIHQYEEYGWLRGFNVIASWGARIEQAWWDYEPGKFREEVALAQKAHANCIRLWIEFTPWMADPEGVTESFLDAVAAIDECGMKTMPCLFNRWHDQRWDYGGTYTEDLYRDWSTKIKYVKELVAPLANDERVLIWDLCNEPQASDLNSDVNKREFAWLSDVADAVQSCNAQQPITIGTWSGENINIYAPLCDVLCYHPYPRTLEHLKGGLELNGRIQKAHGKPMLANEAIPGCLDDQKRAECARYSIEALEDIGWGWMGWGMREGAAISTRRDRYDDNGIDNQGFHAWFTKDGELRPGLEFLLDSPRLKPPWGNR